MTTIDHAAEARRLITGAQNPPAGMTTEEVGITAAMAQVHATLALVEQQRIANVIALGQVRSMDGDRPFRHLIMQPINEFDVGPTDDIKKGLGL